MKINAYDNRPLDEIRNDLLYQADIDFNDVLCTCIILCDRIQDMQSEIDNLRREVKP